MIEFLFLLRLDCDHSVEFAFLQDIPLWQSENRIDYSFRRSIFDGRVEVQEIFFNKEKQELKAKKIKKKRLRLKKRDIAFIEKLFEIEGMDGVELAWSDLFRNLFLHFEKKIEPFDILEKVKVILCETF